MKLSTRGRPSFIWGFSFTPLLSCFLHCATPAATPGQVEGRNQLLTRVTMRGISGLSAEKIKIKGSLTGDWISHLIKESCHTGRRCSSLSFCLPLERLVNSYFINDKWFTYTITEQRTFFTLYNKFY